ncbi:hypothetical protein KPH14_001236 [Odynerus spinipes]|uniref:Small EDRK-rich factor-like N-terminal domain-containing protein n=1 Tax=Odynerus spinipes TaxID=1348599 RepID=A0AAD9VMY8_9HYME|nr:hypothetical protein KPH14_001236 [Odynerus spinipes]
MFSHVSEGNIQFCVPKSNMAVLFVYSQIHSRFSDVIPTVETVKKEHSQYVHFTFGRMARGQQKIQSQAKAAEKAAKVKKQQGHSANDQKKAAQKALVHVCSVCKAQMPDPKTYKQHFENKHPKNELPDDLKNFQSKEINNTPLVFLTNCSAVKEMNFYAHSKRMRIINDVLVKM